MKRSIFLALAATVLLAGAAHAQSPDPAVLDSLQYTGFNYFWSKANPANGLCPDRSATGSVCSIASTGFGLSAICVGADHGWITRDQAKQRVLTTLQTFWNGPQGPAASGTIGYMGLYYHWLDMNTAKRTWSSELSTIDTALLFAGILHCREYFSVQGDPTEDQIRALADSITWRADWNWVRGGTPGIAMGWDPASGLFGKWIGYNEAMIMYLIAIGSPTHPAPPSDWSTWTSGYTWGQSRTDVPAYVKFGPLFGHQYSHCWVDFRGIQDAYMAMKGIDYFENSRRATLSQISYGRIMGTPLYENYYHRGYSDSLWGWTASDDPATGYMAHDPWVANLENGTVTPTASISSIAFAPDSVWPCVRNMFTNRNTLGFPYWGPYGFGDAFCPKTFSRWVSFDVLGIDQGPIVLMIENYRNNMIWARTMANADIQRGLSRAGFLRTAGVPGPAALPGIALSLSAEPNPSRGLTTLRYRLGSAARVRLTLFDTSGRRVSTLVDEDRPAGEHSFQVNGRGLAPGVYLYRLEANGASVVRRAVLLD
jgi:hypothetical protein